MPDRILDMTRRELIDWLTAAGERLKDDARDQNWLAYHIGYAVACGYASVKGAAQGVVYPTFDEMFPRKLTPEEEAEQEEKSWRMHREELIGNLRQGKKRG